MRQVIGFSLATLFWLVLIVGGIYLGLALADFHRWVDRIDSAISCETQ